MIAYRAKLNEYFMKRKVIGLAFCVAAAEAEDEFETASRSATPNAISDVAHNILKAKFRDAKQARLDALTALGSPPVMPT